MATTNTARSGRKGRTKDLRDIQPRGSGYRVRVFVGRDPDTGRQLFLTGTAPDEKAAIRLRDQYRAKVAEGKVARTQGTFADLLRELLKVHAADENTIKGYRSLADIFIIPALGSQSLTTLATNGARSFEQFYADLRRCRRRCDRKPFVEHHKGCLPDLDGNRRCDKRCKPHTCKPAAQSTILKIHAVCSIACSAGVRWGWLGVNPINLISRPRAPQPEPNPPSAEEAARLIDEAMSISKEWGALVWLAMVTGARRSELVNLRWNHIHLICVSCGGGVGWGAEKCPKPACAVELGEGSRTATVYFRRGYVRGKEKDTKTHQIRRIALDPVTVDILIALWSSYSRHIGRLDATAQPESYIFSYEVDHSRPYNPDGVTHKYARMSADLGLNSNFHQLRHYSATELLTAGVDLRTVAGRLGHAGGGSTTLRVYAAWRSSADEQAAALLAARLPVSARHEDSG